MVNKYIKKLLNKIVEIYAKIKNIEIYKNNTGETLTILEKERKDLKEKVEDHKKKIKKLKSWRKEFEEKLLQDDKNISDKELYELLVAQEESEEETMRLEIETEKLNNSHENKLKEIRNDINTRTALVISVALFILVCGSFILFLSYYGLENFRENFINIRNESEIRMALIGVILIFFSTSFILEVLIKNKSDKFFFIQYIPALTLFYLVFNLDLESKVHTIVFLILMAFSLSLWAIFTIFKIIEGLRRLHSSLILKIENAHERATIYISIIGSIWAAILILFR